MEHTPNDSSINVVVENNLSNTNILTFNIGPSFLHMISYNQKTGRSFNYLYDFNNYNRIIENKYDIKISELCSNELKRTKLNNKKIFIVKVNVYKEKCACEKCLSGTFFFYGKQPGELRNELLEVLCSEHCISWNEKWIENILEQMLIIFSSIKNGLVYERLLETACMFAKTVVAKYYQTDLLEYKYSYVHFQNKFKENIRFSKPESQGKKNNENKQNIFIFGHGKSTVEQDMVDGFFILSFKTKEEMNEFSDIDLDIRRINPTSFLSINKEEHKQNIFTVFKANKENINGNNNFLRIVEMPSPSVFKSQNKEVDEMQKTFTFLPKQNSNKKFKPKRISTKIFESDFLDEFLKNTSEKIFSNGMQITPRNNDDTDTITSTSADFSDSVNLQQNKEEIDEVYSYACSYIPILHGCDKHYKNLQMCTCNSFSLGMILNIGKGRPLPKVAVENLDKLSKNNSTISYRMAAIAACALNTSKNGNLKRIIVPVVSTRLVLAVREWEYNVCHKRFSQDSLKSENEFSVNPDVEEMLNDLLHKVSEMKPDDSLEIITIESPKKVRNKPGRKRMSGTLRELQRLSASLVDESALLDLVKNHKYCRSDNCGKDCDCENALRFVINSSSKCEKKSCLIDCTCSDKCDYDENDFQEKSGELVRELTSKYQTVISMKDGKNINITTLTDKSKRKKRLSSRFNNSVLLDEDAIASYEDAIASYPAIRPPKKRKVGNAEKSQNGRFNFRGKVAMNRKFKFCVDKIKRKKTLGDIFVWCAYHNKYNCICPSWIARMKENTLLWKPLKIIKYTTNKIMSKIKIPERRTLEVFFYDHQEYSARTFGSQINYNIRNQTDVFLAKRKYELKHGILSSSNSFIKNKFLIYKPFDEVEQNEFSEVPGKIDVFKGVSKKNVHIVPENQCTDLIEVDICNFESDVYDIISFYKEHNYTLKTYLNPKKVYKQKEENVSVVERSSKESKSSQTESLTSLRTEEELDITLITQRDECEPENQIMSHVEDSTPKLGVNNLFNNATPSENAPLLQNLQYCINSNNSSNESEFDHELIQLKDHPMKDQIYGPDNLPKLALLCVTPGIGYLPIIQFNPDVLVVQDPIYPELFRSFKNLKNANIWLNKFLKDFFVFKSIQIYLKWIIVKPGIIKLKQSQPFSPAILENSPIIFTKDGGLKFSNKDYKCKNLLVEVNKKDQHEKKRKFIQSPPECVVDIEGNDGKRRKIHLETGSPSNGNFPQFLSKKKIVTSSILHSPSSVLINKTISQNTQNISNTNMETQPIITSNIQPTYSSSSSKFLPITNTNGEYKVATNLLIPKILPSTLLHKSNNNNNNSSFPFLKIMTLPGDSVTGAKIVTCDYQPIIMANTN